MNYHHMILLYQWMDGLVWLSALLAAFFAMFSLSSLMCPRPSLWWLVPCAVPVGWAVYVFAPHFMAADFARGLFLLIPAATALLSALIITARWWMREKRQPILPPAELR